MVLESWGPVVLWSRGLGPVVLGLGCLDPWASPSVVLRSLGPGVFLVVSWDTEALWLFGSSGPGFLEALGFGSCRAGFLVGWGSGCLGLEVLGSSGLEDMGADRLGPLERVVMWDSKSTSGRIL